MVAKLQKENGELDSLKRPQLSLGFQKDEHLKNFVTPKTLFEILRLDYIFSCGQK